MAIRKYILLQMLNNCLLRGTIIYEYNEQHVQVGKLAQDNAHMLYSSVLYYPVFPVNVSMAWHFPWQRKPWRNHWLFIGYGRPEESSQEQFANERNDMVNISNEKPHKSRQNPTHYIVLQPFLSPAQ